MHDRQRIDAAIARIDANLAKALRSGQPSWLNGLRASHGRYSNAHDGEELVTALALLGADAFAAALSSGASMPALQAPLLELCATVLDAEAAAMASDAPGPELPVDRIPLDAAAAISASIACRPDERPSILGGKQLTNAVWAALHTHWTTAIASSLKTGRPELLAEYDDAYVAQLEKERGQIAVADYARLVVAGERGDEATVASELRLPPSSVARIKRVWLRKSLRDQALARQVRAAIDAC